MRRLCTILTMTMLWLVPSVASAEWFLDAYGGYSMPTETTYDRSSTVSTTPPNTHAILELERGLDMGGGSAVGVRAGWFGQDVRWLGFSVEALYLRSTIEAQSATETRREIQGFTQTGQTQTTRPIGRTPLHVGGAVFSVLIRYPGDYLQPYASGGIGGLYADASDSGFGGLSTVDVGWSYAAGLKLFLSTHLSLFAEYKAVGADFGSGEFGGTHRELTYRSDNMLAGLSYHWR